MANDFVSLQHHPLIPAIPIQSTPKCDLGCIGCALKNKPNHATVSTFTVKPEPAVVDENRINLRRMGNWQYQIFRRAFDADFIAGAPGDFWYRWNPDFTRAVNYVYWTGFKIASASGNQITLEKLSGDTREILEATWRERDEIGLFWLINFLQSFSAITPGDAISFPYPSAAHNKLNAIVTKIISCNETQITLELDKDVSNCTSTLLFDPDTETPPDYLTCNVYCYGRTAQIWDYAYMIPFMFFGERKQEIIEHDDLNEDKIWIIDGTIQTHHSYDPLDSPNIVMEGYNGTHWETISDNSRWIIDSSVPVSAYSFGTTKHELSLRDNPSTDLTATYERFRCVYYLKTTPDNPNCEIRGFDRCFHSRLDPSGSVANYGTTYGVASDDDGQHYCNSRIVEVHTKTDEVNRFTVPASPGTDGYDDTVYTTQQFASAVSTFTPACTKYNVCDQYENSLDKLGDAQSPFNVDYKLANILKNLLFASDQRLVQSYVLASTYYPERIKHPSVHWLLGWLGNFHTNDGWHERIRARGMGTWAFPYQDSEGNYYYTDADGNQRLVPTSGLETQNHSYSWDDESYNYSTPSKLRTTISGYDTKKNPLNASETVSNGFFELIGGSVQRDTGIMLNERSLNHASLALPEQVEVICPNIDLSLTEVQTRSQASFEKLPGEDAKFRILPLRQGLKSEVNLGSRVIHDAVNVSGNVWKIQFENTSKTFSRLDTGNPGEFDSTDKLFVSVVSGGPVIKPYEWQAINSYHTEDKTTGARNAGLAPGDCMELGDKRFIVTNCEPSYGDEAPTWGNKQIPGIIPTAGYYSPSFVEGEEDEFYPIIITSVINLSDSSTAMEVLSDDIDKPELANNQVWFDNKERLFFSSLQDTHVIQINGVRADEATFTEYFTVQKNQTIIFDLQYSDWTGSNNQTVYIGGVAVPSANVTVGGTDPVDAGEVRINESGSGRIELTYNIDDAGNNVDIKVLLKWNIEGAAPDDDWNVVGKGYLDYAKKYDVCWIIDDSNYFSTNATEGETANFYQSATVFIPKDDLEVQWTIQGTDDWETIPDPYIAEVNAASGLISITHDFFDIFESGDSYSYEYGYGLEGNICIKANDVALVDHRSNAPASLFNRIDDMIASMGWVWTSTGGGFGDFSIDKGVFRSWGSGNLGWKYPDGPCEVDDFDSGFQYGTAAGGSGNRFYFDSVDGTSQAGINVSSTSFGIFNCLQNFPDGMTINVCYAEISAGGLTRSYVYQTTGEVDCDLNVIEEGVNPDGIPDTSISDVTYSVLAFSGEDDFEVISSISAAASGSRVVDITPIAQYMYDNRNSTTITGYGIIFSPIGLGDGEGIGLEQYIEKPKQALKGHVCNDTECYSKGDKVLIYETLKYLSITWNNISIGNVCMNVTYPESMNSMVLQPRLPSMKNSISS